MNLAKGKTFGMGHLNSRISIKNNRVFQRCWTARLRKDLESRTKAQRTMMFMIVNSLVDVPLEQYLNSQSTASSVQVVSTVLLASRVGVFSQM